LTALRSLGDRGQPRGWPRVKLLLTHAGPIVVTAMFGSPGRRVIGSLGHPVMSPVMQGACPPASARHDITVSQQHQAQTSQDQLVRSPLQHLHALTFRSRSMLNALTCARSPLGVVLHKQHVGSQARRIQKRHSRTVVGRSGY
jgi:hypothetical protein